MRISDWSSDGCSSDLRQRALQLLVVMGAHPQPDPGAAQGGEVGAVEILLAEVHEAAALLDGEAPVVVHDELAAGGFAEVTGCADLGPRLRLTAAFNTELHQLDSQGQQPAQPIRAVDDRKIGRAHV